ncbi:MAG: SGNH/GDSL hydrolase family protein [Clostridia bacterium]|nr:SGNH/GDSL hydrolase family protein [Clostridia bacterium]
MKTFKKISALFLCIVIVLGTSNGVLAQEINTKSLSATAVLSNNQVMVDVVSEGFGEENIAIAALFDAENNFVCMSSSDITSRFKITFPAGSIGTKVYIFLWKGLKNMQPLCDVVVTEVENPLYGKKLYVDGDSICYGNGYKGGYGKIIADKYGMQLVNNGVGGATISKGTLNIVKYGKEMKWDENEFYLQLSSYDPIEDKGTEGFAINITKEQYENGFGVYPTAYVMKDGALTALPYSEEIPKGRFYLKFDIPTYGGNTVTKYYRMWCYTGSDGNLTGNMWLWEAYKSGFEGVHESGQAKIGTKRHWLCESVNEIDEAADYIVFEGGVNEYLMGRPIGELSDGKEPFDTTTTIGALEYICDTLVKKYSDKKVIYVITPRAKNYTTEVHATASIKATWQDYHDAIISVLEKYNIQYVDLFETEFDTANEEYLQYTYKGDGVHPTQEGYEKFFVPYIVEAMLS